MSLRRFDEIEHMLKEMCGNNKECRAKAAQRLVMQTAMESEPNKINVTDFIRNGSEIRADKR